MPEPARNPLGVLAVVAFVGLAAVVLGIGAIGMVAEFSQAWSSYFLFERAVTTATPVSAALFVGAVLTAVLTAVTT